MTIYNGKTITEILSAPNSRLGRLINKAKQLESTTQLFRRIVGGDLSRHCHVGGYDGKILNLVVESAAWATQLRYSIPDLIKTLKVQPEFQTLQKIHYRIRSRQ